MVEYYYCDMIELFPRLLFKTFQVAISERILAIYGRILEAFSCKSPCLEIDYGLQRLREVDKEYPEGDLSYLMVLVAIILYLSSTTVTVTVPGPGWKIQMLFSKVISTITVRYLFRINNISVCQNLKGGT